MKKVGPYDFVFGLVAMFLLIALTGGLVIFFFFAWAVVEFAVWFSRKWRKREHPRHA